jgi:hypothetical protein
LVIRQVFLRKDCIYWALGFTQAAVDTFFRINNKEIRALVKAVYRTDFHAVCVFAANASITNHIGHCFLPEPFAGFITLGLQGLSGVEV